MSNEITAKEREIVELVARGYRVKAIVLELAKRGRFVSAATVASTIRTIATKLDNPHGLTPLALIRSHFTNKAA